MGLIDKIIALSHTQCCSCGTEPNEIISLCVDEYVGLSERITKMYSVLSGQDLKWSRKRCEVPVLWRPKKWYVVSLSRWDGSIKGPSSQLFMDGTIGIIDIELRRFYQNHRCGNLPNQDNFTTSITYITRDIQQTHRRSISLSMMVFSWLLPSAKLFMEFIDRSVSNYLVFVSEWDYSIAAHS